MDFYPTSSGIDLRDEMHRMIYGGMGVIGQGRPVLLRHLTDTPCACVQPNGSADDQCPYCQGEGFQFWETQEYLYIARGVAPIYKPGYLATGNYPQASYGYTDPNRATGFCEYTVFPDYERYINGQKKTVDKVYELKPNIDGSGPLLPLTRMTKWKVLSLTPLHGDQGRVEFFECALESEDF